MKKELTMTIYWDKEGLAEELGQGEEYYKIYDELPDETTFTITDTYVCADERERLRKVYGCFVLGLECDNVLEDFFNEEEINIIQKREDQKQSEDRIRMLDEMLSNGEIPQHEHKTMVRLEKEFYEKYFNKEKEI